MAKDDTATQPKSYTGEQVAKAYEQIYGVPYPNKGLAASTAPFGGAYTALSDPQGNKVGIAQLMFWSDLKQQQDQQQKQQQQAAAAGGGTAAGGGVGGTGTAAGTGWASPQQGTASGTGWPAPQQGTYYTQGASTGGSMPSYTNQPQIQQGNVNTLVMPGGGALSAADSQRIMDLYSSYEGGNAQAGQTLVQWLGGMGMNPGQLNTAVSNLRNQTGPNAAPTIGGAGGVQPETTALAQMAQIDPTGEALRQQVGQSYLSTLQGTPAPTFRPGAAPAAGDIQGYLDLYKQIDPQGYAQHVALGGSMQDLVARAQQQMALGSQLDPSTAREVDQATREAQIARGNVYGTPQLVQEAMTRGQAGLALQQQRLQNLSGALGQQQGYLSSGQTLGDIANTLYGQGWQRNMATYQQQLAARQAAQQGAVGYLGSGQTPYQAGASYLNTAEQRAAAAAQGGASYNPQGPSGYYTGQGAASFPQYGLDMSQLANQWGQSMNYANLTAYGMTPQKSGGGAAGAGLGALGGAASGAMAGAAAGGVGAIPGALIGAIGGGAKGYFS